MNKNVARSGMLVASQFHHGGVTGLKSSSTDIKTYNPQFSKMVHVALVEKIKKNSRRISIVQKFLQEFLQGYWYKILPYGRKHQGLPYECRNNIVTS